MKFATKTASDVYPTPSPPLSRTTFNAPTMPFPMVRACCRCSADEIIRNFIDPMLPTHWNRKRDGHHAEEQPLLDQQPPLVKPDVAAVWNQLNKDLQVRTVATRAMVVRLDTGAIYFELKAHVSK